jgi:hypothetical protein
MKSDSSERNNRRPHRRKLIYVRSLAEIPDFKSDDEIAAWYQTHSTVLIQDQLEALPAKVGGKLRERVLSRARETSRGRKRPLPSRSA